jgi:UDP-glucose:(heptosyl)LPS alpha-1,3-glucosyltransferase
LLVLPALYESFANVCLEAMACGLPVVTSRINGASEIIQQGVNGDVIEEPGDERALAEAIRPFLEPTRWQSASAAARRTAEQLPFEKNVERTLEIISASLGVP